ncbi:hypothetical protein HJG60_011419 [Phyllostomus discolor]|uniref:Large ribosomal subunit protein uL14 n=1 Tax=Phyllostomus discolor TaxID=89673 RepID=A0A834A7X6_9CHIR|nr:hypothetical protein HJG60_011419 [Phyllostomus discolor]
MLKRMCCVFQCEIPDCPWSSSLPLEALVNCADHNTGARNLCIIPVKGIKGRLNRPPAAGAGDVVMGTVEKGKPELGKKVRPAVVIQQRKSCRRKDGMFLNFEGNVGVLANGKAKRKLRHPRSSCKGVCRFVAQDGIQCWQHCMVVWCICKTTTTKKLKISPGWRSSVD